MASPPPKLLAWLSYVLMFSSAFILLGGIAASQQFCGRASANALTVSGAAGYFANVSCDKLYRLTWFVTWYQIAMAAIVPAVLATGSVHRWRYGLIGLLLPLTYLLQITANSFYIQKVNIDSEQGASRAVLAGAIIGSAGNYFLLILLGIRDEKPGVAEE